MATTKVGNDLIDLNQTGNTTALKGCKGTTAQQPGKTGQPAAVEGMLRTNTSLTSGGSASAMQFYKNTGSSMTSGWVTLNNFTTLTICDYPTTATALYQFQDTANETCGPNPFRINNLTYDTGVPRFGATNKAVEFNGSDSVWNSSSSIVKPNCAT